MALANLQEWRPKSLTFALADAEIFRYIILWTGETINFAIATVFGVFGGSLLAALISGTFNWVAPPLVQFRYSLVGGLLMGFGAVRPWGRPNRFSPEPGSWNSAVPLFQRQTS
ncbi:YeeE/YedE thiosulfate transporter family protein [Desulfobacterota bacterium M19]